MEEGSGGAAVFTVGEGDEEGREEAEDSDDDGGDAGGAPEPGVEGFEVGEVERGSEQKGGHDDDEEEGG